MKHISIINGPNLNLLGKRETHLYGNETLENINADLAKKFLDKVILSFFQSNHEGAIIDHIHSLVNDSNGLIINPGGLTHTSVALRDAILGTNIPSIEVHLTNIYARESFRQKSLISSICIGVISGFGPMSYELAIRSFLARKS
jgi:3-dehydroquinate dehydratase-2